MVHQKVMMCSRYMGFSKSLSVSCKFPVKFLASLCQDNLRTVYGKTLRRIRNECASPPGRPPSKNFVKKTMKYYPVPEAESWRPNILKNLLDIRESKAVLPGFSVDEVEAMIEYVCVD